MSTWVPYFKSQVDLKASITQFSQNYNSDENTVNESYVFPFDKKSEFMNVQTGSCYKYSASVPSFYIQKDWELVVIWFHKLQHPFYVRLGAQRILPGTLYSDISFSSACLKCRIMSLITKVNWNWIQLKWTDIRDKLCLILSCIR